jgi:hypothetical protein
MTGRVRELFESGETSDEEKRVFDPPVSFGGGFA